MPITKYGDKDQGRVIPESEEEQKTASKSFTEADREALAKENAEADAPE